MSSEPYHFIERPGSGADAPVLVLGHGTGGDETQFLELGRQVMPHARLLAPRGDVSERGALRFFRRAAEGVYDMADLARATDKMARFVAEAAGTAPVYALGYSNGANIFASVLLTRPELFAGVALMHPLIPWDPDPKPELSGKPVLITAGRNDPICPPERTKALAQFLESQGCTVRVEWHEGGHEVRQNELAALQDFFPRA